MSELKTQNITESDVVLGKIANGLQSVASDHILGISKDIYDTNKQAYQGDINEYLLDKVVLEREVTSEFCIGGIDIGQVFAPGMTFTEFVEKLLTKTFYGSIGSISSSGTVSIAAPTIEVRIKEENGTWTQIDPGTTVKENTTVKVSVTNIPKSELKNAWAGIKKGGNNPGDVLAYGWLKSENGGEAVTGGENCKISTEPYVTGEDHLTIPGNPNAGIFSGANGLKINNDGKIDMEFTIPASSSILEQPVGEIKVQSNSAKYQLKSAHDYEIAALSSKQTSKPEKISDIPSDRKITINKSDIIEDFEKSRSNSSTFKLKVEGWGTIPELEIPADVNINQPKIEVFNVTDGEPGEPINFKPDGTPIELNPNYKIKVNVALDGESEIENGSAYLQKTPETFQYGWEKIEDGVQKEFVEEPTSSQKCTIATYSERGTNDVLGFTGRRTGLFSGSDFKIEDNKISFTKTVGNEASEFSIEAISGLHKLLSSFDCKVYALSSIKSSGESLKMNNHFSCNKNDILWESDSKNPKKSLSTFSFTTTPNPYSTIPDAQFIGIVSIDKPTIVVTQNGNTYNEGKHELDPRFPIHVEVLIPKSTEPTSAFYEQSKPKNYLQYGWQLWLNGEVIKSAGGVDSDTADNCTIEIKKEEYTKDQLVIGSPSGDFVGMGLQDNGSIDFEIQKPSHGGSFKVKAVPAIYTIYPAQDYTIYSTSVLGNTSTDHMRQLYTSQEIGTISGKESEWVTFNYSLKSNGWGSIPATPEVQLVGGFNINKPTIVVTQNGNTYKEGTHELDPRYPIHVKVTVPKSNDPTISAFYKQSKDYLQYGWKLWDGSDYTEAGEFGSLAADNCTIEIKKEEYTKDQLVIGSPSGDFVGMGLQDNGSIDFEIQKPSQVSSFKVKAVPAVYNVYPIKDYTIYSKSQLGDTNTDHMRQLYTSQEIGTISGTESSDVIFGYSLRPDDWSNIPALDIGSPEVSIAKPTIKVTKSGETTPLELNKTVELNPSDTLDIEITLNSSAISVQTEYKGYYRPNEISDHLCYGWKLFESGAQIDDGDKNKPCEIELTTKKDGTDDHTFDTKSGAFSGLNNSTLNNSIVKLSNISVGNTTTGTLKIKSTPSTYTVSPNGDYTIYSLSEYGKHDAAHSEKPESEQFRVNPVYSDSFTYTVKVATYSPFFWWGIPGEVDWEKWDDSNPEFNPTDIYSGEIRNVLDKITDNISDSELEGLGMTKYVYPTHYNQYQGAKIEKGKFLIMLTNNTPYLSGAEGGKNGINDEFLIKTISRNGEDYNIYVFPNEPSLGNSEWYEFKI